jgi:mannobiose 2-epimerase
MDLYQTLQRRTHDRRHHGWLEHFTRDWRLITKRTPGADIEVPGLKSANAHLHLMEAYAELYDVSRDEDVRDSLAEALEINRTRFFAEPPARSPFHRHPDWTPATRPSSSGVCYGHDVEFAWLMIRAQQVLGVPPAWSHFDALLENALRFGWDHERGGLYFSGADGQPATRTDKLWWVQAELLAALTDGLLHEARPDRLDALEKLIRFVRTHQLDPRDGIWLATVAADGTPTNTSKANSWKANYHDLRAIVKFVDAFGG